MERKNKPRPHACSFLTNELLKVEDLRIPLCTTKSPALDEVREVGRLSKPVDETVALSGILLKAELVEVKAVTRARDLFRLLTWVLQILRVAHHDTTRELKECISYL